MTEEQKLKEKIAELEEACSLLSRRITSEKKHSLSEFKNRLASALRCDYQNLIDAKGLPMSEGLGENLRLQLDHVFKTLKREGVDCARYGDEDICLVPVPTSGFVQRVVETHSDGTPAITEIWTEP